jgi:hypothetical protein
MSALERPGVPPSGELMGEPSLEQLAMIAATAKLAATDTVSPNLLMNDLQGRCRRWCSERPVTGETAGFDG